MESLLMNWMNQREGRKQHRETLDVQREAQDRARILTKIEDFRKTEYEPYVNNGQVEEANRRRELFIASNPDVQSYMAQRVGAMTPLPSDRLKAATISANLDAIERPYVSEAPKDASGNVSYDSMHTRMGAGLSPEQPNSIETFRRLNTAYNLQTGDNPNETTSKGFQSFALQGEPGWLEQNRIAGGQLPDANQLTRTGEDRRQFDTRWPFEEKKIRSEIVENDASAFASRELGTNRQQERVIGSDYNNADVDVRRRSAEPARPITDGRFNHLSASLDALVEARNKLIAADKPTSGVDQRIGVVRRDLELRGAQLGVDIYGQPLHSTAPPSVPRQTAQPGHARSAVDTPRRQQPQASGSAPQSRGERYSPEVEAAIGRVMGTFGLSREAAITEARRRGLL